MAKAENISLVADTGSLKLTASGRLSAWFAPAPEATLQRRVEMLEANLLSLKEEVATSTSDLRQADESLRTEVATERKERVAATDDLRVKVDGIGVEGLLLEGIGLLWLIAGVVLATIPNELNGLVERI